MLRAILEFPVLFLGAKPSDTPAFYNFMNFADFGLGTFQPKNGFYDVVQGMISLGKSLGVSYKNNSDVKKIEWTQNVKESSLQENNFVAGFGALKLIKDGWETEAIPKIGDKNVSKIGFFNKFFGSS